MKADINALNYGFGEYIQRRFHKAAGINLNLQPTDNGYFWEWKGVKYSAGFDFNADGNLEFSVGIEFEPNSDIGVKVYDAEQKFSNNRIDKSRFLGKTERRYNDHSYNAVSHIKKSPKKDRTKNTFYDHIFGYLMKAPMAAIHNLN